MRRHPWRRLTTSHSKKTGRPHLSPSLSSSPPHGAKESEPDLPSKAKSQDVEPPTEYTQRKEGAKNDAPPNGSERRLGKAACFTPDWDRRHRRQAPTGIGVLPGAGNGDVERRLRRGTMRPRCPYGHRGLEVSKKGGLSCPPVFPSCYAIRRVGSVEWELRPPWSAPGKTQLPGGKNAAAPRRLERRRSSSTASPRRPCRVCPFPGRLR